MNKRARLRVGVVGVGHLGQHHARIYDQLDECDLVGVCDARRARAEEIAARHSVAALDDPRELIGKVDAVSIATPTEHHFAVARDFLEAGVATLVEKPLCRTVAEARELCALAARRGVPLQVGHIERFNPAILAVRPRIDDPRFISCDRVSPFSFRSADIGVVLDLMIHDLDIALHLARSPVVDVEALGLPVIAPTEDLANARLRFASGGVALLTASRVSIKKMRKIRIFQRDAYISLDYDAKKALLYKRRPGFEWGAADLASVDPSAPPAELQALVFSRYLEIEEISMEGEPLRLELESFVRAVREGREVEVPGAAGLEAMEVADRIVATIGAGIAAEKARVAGAAPDR
jgi:predicted dehydrogenase